MGKRYVEVTHIYVLPIDSDDVSVIDAIAPQGVSMMEDFMRQRAQRIQNLRSDYKIMPKEYNPDDDHYPGNGDQDMDASALELIEEGFITPAQIELIRQLPARQADIDEAKHAIENDADASISFTQGVMGQSPRIPHPWDTGDWIFPEDHPFRQFEEDAKRGDKTANGMFHYIAKAADQLEVGDGEAD